MDRWRANKHQKEIPPQLTKKLKTCTDDAAFHLDIEGLPIVNPRVSSSIGSAEMQEQEQQKHTSAMNYLASICSGLQTRQRVDAASQLNLMPSGLAPGMAIALAVMQPGTFQSGACLQAMPPQPANHPISFQMMATSAAHYAAQAAAAKSGTVIQPSSVLRAVLPAPQHGGYLPQIPASSTLGRLPTTVHAVCPVNTPAIRPGLPSSSAITGIPYYAVPFSTAGGIAGMQPVGRVDWGPKSGCGMPMARPSSSTGAPCAVFPMRPPAVSAPLVLQQKRPVVNPSATTGVPLSPASSSDDSKNPTSAFSAFKGKSIGASVQVQRELQPPKLPEKQQSLYLDAIKLEPDQEEDLPPNLPPVPELMYTSASAPLAKQMLQPHLTCKRTEIL